MTYLSLDYGTYKTGLAYSVENFAFAWKTVATRSLFDTLPQYIREKKAKALILGMPYNIDGTLSAHGKRVQDFAKKLSEHIDVPIIFYDERLTSSEARIAFDEDGTDGDIDAEAARLILVHYLDSIKK